jgi:hypothetical protein
MPACPAEGEGFEPSVPELGGDWSASARVRRYGSVLVTLGLVAGALFGCLGPQEARLGAQ